MRAGEEKRDWDLCQSAWSAIVGDYGENPDATDFLPRERVVVAVWTVSGIIGNGGFEYLFEADLQGDPDYQLSLDALRSIGCHEAVQPFEAALQLFPGGRVPRDPVERDRIFRTAPEEVRSRLASTFWKADTAMVTSLAAYIRKELPEFANGAA